MLYIAFPDPKFLLRTENGKENIYDGIRQKWVRLTPEEWVRQNIICYLTEVKKYPASLLAIEKEIQLGEVKKRCDIVVYKNAQPWMIVECKEPDVPLTKNTLMQAIRYNMANCCSYLLLSNGNRNMGWQIENGIAKELDQLPDWT